MSLTFNGNNNSIQVDTKTLFRVDSSNRTFQNNYIGFGATMDTPNQGWTTPADSGIVPFHYVYYDSHGSYMNDYQSYIDHFANNNVHRCYYTIPVSGYWLISYWFLADNTAGVTASSLYVNGSLRPSNYGDLKRTGYYDTTLGTRHQGGKHILQLNAGDQVQVRFIQGVGKQVWYRDINGFTGRLISQL